jgi:hypothetical protein
MNNLFDKTKIRNFADVKEKIFDFLLKMERIKLNKNSKVIIDKAGEGKDQLIKNIHSVTSVIVKRPENLKGPLIQQLTKEELDKIIEEGKAQIIGDNSVLIGGTQLNAMMMWNVWTPPTRITSFETTLGTLGTPQPVDPPSAAEPWKVYGYNVAIDGALVTTEVLPVIRHSIGIDINNCPPFRMVPLSSDNPDTFLQSYYHRVEFEFDGQTFVGYWTKKLSPTITNVDTGNSILPDYPEINYHESRDVRTLVEFPIQITKLELNEWFRYVKNDPRSTNFSSVIPMTGRLTKQTVNGQQYDALSDTYAYARANHQVALIGSLGSSDLTYILMYL